MVQTSPARPLAVHGLSNNGQWRHAAGHEIKQRLQYHDYVTVKEKVNFPPAKEMNPNGPAYGLESCLNQYNGVFSRWIYCSLKLTDVFTDWNFIFIGLYTCMIASLTLNYPYNPHTGNQMKWTFINTSTCTCSSYTCLVSVSIALSWSMSTRKHNKFGYLLQARWGSIHFPFSPEGNVKPC